MTQLFPIAAITDEFSQDIEAAVRSMTEIGMGGAELRMVFGKNVIDLTDAELDHAREIVGRHGLEIVSIASPLLKCVLPDAPAVDARFQQDVFAATHTFEDQPRLADRALEIAERTGARSVRVFSYWRSVRPETCFERGARHSRLFVLALRAPGGVFRARGARAGATCRASRASRANHRPGERARL